jgi:hypothetical protein
MKPNRTRLVAVAALSVMAMAAPVSTAAATAAPAAPAVTVIGPTFITATPATFVNTNDQVSAGDTWSGGLVAP